MKVKEESEKVGLNSTFKKLRSWHLVSSPHGKNGETMEIVRDFILGSTISTDGDCSLEIKRHAPWKKIYEQPRQHIKKQRQYFPNQGPSSQGNGFSSSHVWM